MLNFQQYVYGSTLMQCKQIICHLVKFETVYQAMLSINQNMSTSTYEMYQKHYSDIFTTPFKRTSSKNN